MHLGLDSRGKQGEHALYTVQNKTYQPYCSLRKPRNTFALSVTCLEHSCLSGIIWHEMLASRVNIAVGCRPQLRCHMSIAMLSKQTAELCMSQYRSCMPERTGPKRRRRQSSDRPGFCPSPPPREPATPDNSNNGSQSTRGVKISSDCYSETPRLEGCAVLLLTDL